MTESKAITKTKNPSRISAGKKLAEWNKMNKQKILEKTDTQDVEKTPTPQDDSKESIRDFSIAGVGIISILAIGILIYYYKATSSTERKIEKEKKNEDNIFIMK